MTVCECSWVCECVHEYVRVCVSVRECVWVCETVWLWVCKCAYVCACMFVSSKTNKKDLMKCKLTLNLLSSQGWPWNPDSLAWPPSPSHDRLKSSAKLVIPPLKTKPPEEAMFMPDIVAYMPVISGPGWSRQEEKSFKVILSYQQVVSQAGLHELLYLRKQNKTK